MSRTLGTADIRGWYASLVAASMCRTRLGHQLAVADGVMCNLQRTRQQQLAPVVTLMQLQHPRHKLTHGPALESTLLLAVSCSLA